MATRIICGDMGIYTTLWLVFGWQVMAVLLAIILSLFTTPKWQMVTLVICLATLTYVNMLMFTIRQDNIPVEHIERMDKSMQRWVEAEREIKKGITAVNGIIHKMKRIEERLDELDGNPDDIPYNQELIRLNRINPL